MGYFNMTYYDSLMHADTKRDLNGTSVSKEKGTDNKANNTSAYNHDYYIHHKEKWQDNKDSKDSKNGSSASANGGDDKSGLKEGDFDLDAAALDVIRGKYGNGQARKDALGADYEMIQKRVNEMYKSGKFGGGTSAPASGDAAASGGSEAPAASSSGKWYTKYDDRIKDTKAAKAQKEAQEAEAKRQQEEAAKEAEAKKNKKKKK